MQYLDGITATNTQYIKNGHADRCKSIKDVYKDPKRCPEEVILQVGSMKDPVSNRIFTECLNEYIEWLEAWSAGHNDCMHMLTIAIHADETGGIHAHMRRVWDYTDKDGLRRIGQNKALEGAGIALPDPDKPQGRYNNRKMTFDSMAREMWQEIAMNHGLQIETEPRPNMKHKSKADYIAGQLQEQIESLRKEYDEALVTAKELCLSDRAEPKTITVGIGKQKHEIVDISPDEYTRMIRAVNAALNESQRANYERREAERLADRERQRRAILEKAIEIYTDKEQRAQIMTYIFLPEAERLETEWKQRELMRTDREQQAKGRKAITR